MFNCCIDKYLYSSNNSDVNSSKLTDQDYNSIRYNQSIFTPASIYNFNTIPQTIFYPNYFFPFRFGNFFNFFNFFNPFSFLNSTIQNFNNLTTSECSLRNSESNFNNNNIQSITPKLVNLNSGDTNNEFKKLGYNNKKGDLLVQNAMQYRRTTPLAKGEEGSCAKYVKNAISRSNLGEYINGDAWQCADIMSNNKNFKEIKISPDNFKKLPAGCVIVYPKGDAGYSSKYGHIIITKGDGSSISEFASNTIAPSSKARVFMPV